MPSLKEKSVQDSTKLQYVFFDVDYFSFKKTLHVIIRNHF